MSSKDLLVSTAIFYHYIYFVVLCLRHRPFDLQGFPDPHTYQIYLSYIVQNIVTGVVHVRACPCISYKLGSTISPQ